VQDDGTLARRVSNGDRPAEAELCARLFPRLCAWGLARLRDDSLARDVAQQALMIALERLRQREISDPERIASFVLGIANNVASTTRRGEKRRAAILESVAPTLETTAEVNETVLDRPRLHDCFELLSPRARTVLALTFYAEKDGEEIASELGMTATNVRVARHRALGALHDCMTEKS